MNGVGIGISGAGLRPGPMPSLRTTHPDAFAHGCGRKDCLRGAASPDCELHGNIVRDIIRSRREERRARLQQRCRAQSNEGMAMAAAAAAAAASRSVTPLRRQLSQSSKPESPRSIASEFSPCVSPLMEDLMLEITDAIESSETTPQVTNPLQRPTSTFDMDMDDIYRLIDEAQREYESLGEPPVAQVRREVPVEPRWMREDCWESLLGRP
ncbi:hypothetical protein CPLU01_05000 [Colletotrichum plurivorum]|uniref:Uncharacterized protein n=1 Tax=Colletotrichum plurivorum TaxID=2175906 RepID=A0A8H6NI86_9PEZI|nr:hypothetical protein CPLU01_05000 [Colletotrichum plurivorum]